MSFADVLSKCEFNAGFGDIGIQRIKNALRQIYGTESGRAMLDLLAQRDAATAFDYAEGKAQALNNPTDENESLELDLMHLETLRFVDQFGQIIKRYPLAVVLAHELSHLVNNFSDAADISDILKFNTAEADYSGTNVRFENLLISELGLPFRRTSYYNVFESALDRGLTPFFKSGFSNGTEVDLVLLTKEKQFPGGYADTSVLPSPTRDLIIDRDFAANTFISGGGDDFLYGFSGADRLKGGSGNDWLFGGNQNDVLQGDKGDDHLVGGRGADRFVGVARGGFDTIVDFEDNVDKIDLRGLAVSDPADLSMTDSYDGVRVGFAGQNFFVKGQTSLTIRDDILLGTSGNPNQITFQTTGRVVFSDNTSGGAVYLYSEEGSSILPGHWISTGSREGFGTYVYALQNVEPTAKGLISDSVAVYRLNTVDGNQVLTLLGVASTPERQYEPYGSDPYNRRVISVADTELRESLVSGSGSADFLEFSGHAVNISARGGDDYASASGKSVVLDGGDGNDQLGAVGNAIYVSGGPGSDLINGLIDAPAGEVPSASLFGGDGDDTLDLDLYHSDISESAGAMIYMDGGAGADMMSIRAVSVHMGMPVWGSIDFVIDDPGDRISFEPSGAADNRVSYDVTVNASISKALNEEWFWVDRLVLWGDAFAGTGRSGDDTIVGTDKANALIGNGGADLLDAAGGADTLDGGDGDDVLKGGAGGDTLAGGNGNDRYVYAEASDSGTKSGTRDAIDFQDGSDVIDLSAITATGGSFIGTAGFTDIGQVRVQQSGSDVLILMNLDMDGKAELAIVARNCLVSQFDASDFAL